MIESNSVLKSLHSKAGFYSERKIKFRKQTKRKKDLEWVLCMDKINLLLQTYINWYFRYMISILFMYKIIIIFILKKLFLKTTLRVHTEEISLTTIKKK